MTSSSSYAVSGARSSGRSGFFPRLFGMMAVHSERRRLADLDDATLRDIGLTRDDALIEAGRPLWDVPPRWRR